LQVLNLIILILYRTGYSGQFLGVGGTWNLNEEKNPDAEIVASGVFVGFFIYTAVVLISFCLGSAHQKKTLVVSFQQTALIIIFSSLAIFWLITKPKFLKINEFQEEKKS
jgi:hypothetical protein